MIYCKFLRLACLSVFSFCPHALSDPPLSLSLSLRLSDPLPPLPLSQPSVFRARESEREITPVLKPNRCSLPQMETMGRVYPPSRVEFMELALEQARFAFDNLEVPIGCVIVEIDKVIASGSNRTTETRNATRHAEMEAIDFLLDKWQKDGLNQMQVAEKFSRCDLYVTCEPCIMCATALSILGIREVYYGCANDKFGGCGSILSLHQTDSEKMSRERSLQGKGFKCTGGLMSTEAIALLRSFYEQGNPNAPKPHRPVRASQQ